VRTVVSGEPERKEEPGGILGTPLLFLKKFKRRVF
jgi:hypothetical protein